VRLLVVVQRYGLEIAGGSEQAARLFATQLTGRGHDVDVVTSCARSYVDWANEYPPGTEQLDGVNVHRLPVAQIRSDRSFGPLNARAVYGNKPVPLHLQQQWMKEQGPYLPQLAGWIEERAHGYDATIFFTYLYFTSWAGIPAAWHRAPIVFHPTAHDEPPLYLPLFDPMFRMASAFSYFTDEEADLVARRFRVKAPGAVIGIGQDFHATADPDAFRAAHGLGDTPYLLYVGRVDPGKGSDELYDYFVAYKTRNPGPLRLVIVGEPVKPLAPHPDLTVTGFVDDDMKQAAMAGAVALVHPSYFESFGMNLTESWIHGRPALVQGRCEVLDGQVRRAGGGIPYRGYAEFEAAVDRLSADPDLQRQLGEQGRRYVEANYRWDVVLDRYQELLDRAVADFR
jgi:glycosyltransferase involved in cell wall biosynthesis